MNKFVRIRPHILAVALIGVTVLLSGCGDSGKDKAKAKAATGKIRTYYSTWNRPSTDWEIHKVRTDKDLTVTVEAKVASKKLTRAIMERSKAEQIGIARLACPAYTDPVWADIDKKQHVGIMLSGSAGHIINALCKRP